MGDLHSGVVPDYPPGFDEPPGKVDVLAKTESFVEPSRLDGSAPNDQCRGGNEREARTRTDELGLPAHV